jgi:hypothetical protein
VNRPFKLIYSAFSQHRLVECHYEFYQVVVDEVRMNAKPKFNMNAKPRFRWWVDVGLFAGFIVAFFMDLTGVELHQWIGVIGAALAAYHLITHWEWINAVTQRFFGRTSGKARLYYLLDAAILIGFLNIIATGLLISTWLNLSLGTYDAWLAMHILASIGTLLLTALKLGLHWRWIALTSRQTLSQPAASQKHAAPVERVTGARRMSRREFLEVMGVVSAASILALSSATKSLNNLNESLMTASAQANTESTARSSSASSSSASSSSASSSSASSNSSSSNYCQVQCERRCSYPGHCRRYVDANNNSRCDYGECV